jgi:hypothetical protein
VNSLFSFYYYYYNSTKKNKKNSSVLFPIWIVAKMNVYTVQLEACSMSFVVRSLSFLSARQQIASLDSFSCWSMSLVGHSIYTCKRTEERKQVLNIMSMRSGARSRIWELLHLFQSVCIKCAWKEMCWMKRKAIHNIAEENKSL